MTVEVGHMDSTGRDQQHLSVYLSTYLTGSASREHCIALHVHEHEHVYSMGQAELILLHKVHYLLCQNAITIDETMISISEILNLRQTGIQTLQSMSR